MFCARRNITKLALETLKCCSGAQINENATQFVHSEVAITKLHDSVARYPFLLGNFINRRQFVTLAQFRKANSARTSALTTVRHKKKSPKSINRDEELDEETDQYVEELDDESVQSIGGKELTVHVPSLRIDTVLKAGMSTSRTKMEEAFYEGRVRINGIQASKKSSMVGLGDEVDLVIGTNALSDRYLDVSRLNVVALRFPKEVGTNITVKLRRHKSLTIENYEDKWSTKEEE